jgi:hypothetical protein
MRNRFHSICPYFAMFPETFVRRNVLAWTKRSEIVLDPFCGRGTTVFESLLNGRRALGCDLNPVAVCVSRAKALPPSLADVLKRLDKLEAAAPAAGRPKEQRNPFFALCFERETLRQVVFLRSRLNWRSDRIDCFIAALALGALHGESHRTDWCFSNRMPRTISTKPAYSVRWWRKRHCTPPRRNVFAILRALAKYRFESPTPVVRGTVVEGDARRAKTLLRRYRGRVKLVITSPPYLDITNYHEDQWLRLWFLGGPSAPDGTQGRDDRYRNVPDYWMFMKEAWAGVVPLLHKKGHVVVRIGGNRLHERQLRDGLLRSLNASGIRFKLAEVGHTPIRNGQKRSFNSSKTAASEFDFRFRIA